MHLKIEEHDITQTTSFGTAYLRDDPAATSFFHYSPYEHASYEQRAADLKERTFERKRLAEVIRDYLAAYRLTPAIKRHLIQLEEENSVVVLGGQQAGLLSGPLYTMYKAITILQLAKQQEEKLGIPVIPIFWIAGEDHDLQEVNHVYVPRKQGIRMDKLTVDDPSEAQKWSMADRPLPKSEIEHWLTLFFDAQPETEFTNEIKGTLFALLEQSDTYVDFFARIMHDCFGEFGLLMVQSADRRLRQLETAGFLRVLDHYDDIDRLVRQSIKQMAAKGFSPQVQVGDHPALLFIYENKERLLLEKIGADQFRTKDGRLTYSLAELREMAATCPERLSNNVITRPFMQESLFPTLAFVGGPGEIAYWALYKTYFEHLGLKLPVLVPRISMTLVEKPIAKVLKRYHISPRDVFSDFQRFRREWLAEQDELQLQQTFDKTKEKITSVYQPLLAKVNQVDQGMFKLGQKNLGKIIEQVEYLEKRAIAAYESKHAAALRQFDKVEQMLIPEQSLQERIYNPYVFLNKHGPELVRHLLETPFSLNGKHKLIYLHAKD